MATLSDSHHSIDDIKYHSPDNQNIISWLPFRKTDKILIINPKSPSISNYLHQNTESVDEVSTDNSPIIDSSKNYDFIFLENYTDILSLRKLFNDFLKHLSSSGIIIFPFTNSLGLNTLITGNIPNSLTKQFIGQVTKDLNLNIEFYNVFPNHFIPEIIFSDDYLNINHDLTYIPLNLNSNIVTQNELSLFRNFLQIGDISNYSNSYLALISKSSQFHNLNLSKFIKFNNYRKPEYNLVTFFKDNKYYKKPNFINAQSFLNEVKNTHQEIKNLGFNILDMKSEGNTIYSTSQPGINLSYQIKNEYYNTPATAIKTIKNFWKEIKSKYKPIPTRQENNIFQKFDIKISSEKNKNLHFVSKLYLDMIPQNVILKNNKYFFYDQEWSIKNAPLEFLLYRILSYTSASLTFLDYKSTIKTLLKEFKLLDFEQEFKLLDEKFVNSIYNNWYQYYKLYQDTISISDYKHQFNSAIETIKKLEQIINVKDQDIQNLQNSTSWKITKPIRRLGEKISQLK